MASPDALVNLTDQFLIAIPGMADSTFSDTVVYVCEHNERGTSGLIVNRPIDIDLVTLFDKIDLKFEIHPLTEQSVYYGGPVQIRRGFVLHDITGAYSSSLAVPGGLEVTTSKDVLEAVTQGGGPHRFILTLGYAGRSAGQLEDEINRSGWPTVQADPEIIFSVPPGVRFAAALNLLGINPAMLSDEAGHA